MALIFEESIPSEVIDYYEIETASVILGATKFLQVRREDLWYFDFDKDVVEKFVKFILDRIEEGNRLNSNLRNLFVKNRIKYPGEY